MHAVTERYLREWLKEGLAQLEPRHQNLFARMYASADDRGFSDEPLIGVDEVVDGMDVNKLENAVDQVQRTLRKRGIEKL